MSDKKVMLIIRDGWGFREDCYLNAICEGETSFTDYLMKSYPNVIIEASGEAVGLSEGYQGNSEVGHMTIGGGRVMLQSMMRINRAIEDGSFFEIGEFNRAIDRCVENKSTLHLAGILQTEGVHGLREHLFALLDLCKRRDFEDVVVHVFTDGRDAPVHDSLKHLAVLYEKFEELGFGRVATVSGRFYAMDRDRRWEKTKRAYDVVVSGETDRVFGDAVEYLEGCHGRDETDEFVVPGRADWYEGVRDGDSFIFYNYRTDRPRQLTQAIVESDFEGFERREVDLYFVGMTDYYRGMSAEIAFKDLEARMFLGEYLSLKGLRQLRISETEKYAHVTFFFNGQIEEPYEGEERILVPSPKVKTYDLMPEMSVYKIADELCKRIGEQDFDLVVANLVNGDMVGHTGVIPAIKQAVYHVDRALKQIVEKGLERGYDILVFADHGNAEDQTEQWRTSHTVNPVPCILVSGREELRSVRLKEGKGLADIAPTVLKLLGLAKPEEMSGEGLF
jgi:2,3-bisphosphoglycerate-independent phosphoglycerate mutase